MTYIDVNEERIFLKHCPYHTNKSIHFYVTKIKKAFEKIGITDKYLDINYGGNKGFRTPAWAEVVWYVNGDEYRYKCTSQDADVQNLAAIAQVIEQDSKAIRRGLKSFGQVMNQFRLDYNPEGARVRSPREILGVPSDTKDFEYITFKYKKLCKENHPDVGGSTEKMSELNNAYNALKEELGKE